MAGAVRVGSHDGTDRQHSAAQERAEFQAKQGVWEVALFGVAPLGDC